MSCFNGKTPEKLHEEGLLLHFDITNPESWDPQSDELNVKSLLISPQSHIPELDLADYGKVAFDYGQGEYDETLAIRFTDDKMLLKPIGGNVLEEDQIISSDSYIITPQLCEEECTSGHYFSLQGGYLNNFFKLHDYGYQVIPSRYMEGITFETTVIVSDDTFSDNYTNGIFLYLGPKGLVKERGRLEMDDVLDNAIAFRMKSDRTLSVRTLEDKGIATVKDVALGNTKIKNGANVIAITYTPYSEIPSADLIDCWERRIGELTVMVNGVVIAQVKDYPEFMFREVTGSKEDQVGLPFTLSWGGGAFGMRHAWGIEEEELHPITYENKDLIERVFGGSFIGGIQKLRVYDRALTFNEMRDNYNFEAELHGLKKVKGGR
jgi:hypothetical protein